MTTMSDDGDRTCPLCTEEMDLTDQNLKPCRCGYEICVWCWHHIMEMAEKDGLEGRCPACRTVYDKQKIVGMADKRMVAEIGTEKKQKSQKTKNKSSTMDDRKYLSNVRVVQRNLVYIMGMPSNLADENILERKEYFGQYGKILKVSVCRQAGATTQQASSNNTFNVYITYVREDEAFRCIQAVHNFVLDGKTLRACFGTTKYCYTWLRNMTCTNPDCLYLHEIGGQEDSFTKDEIISAYTRSRVPQIPSNNLQPRAGNVLPPPVDESCNNGAASTKNSTRVSFNNATNQVRSTPIDISVPRSTGLPAAASWGLRSSNSRSPASSMVSMQNPPKQKTEVIGSSSSSSVLSSIKQNSAWHDDTVANSKIPEGRPMVHADGQSGHLEPLKHGNVQDLITKVADASSGSALDVDHSSSAWDDDTATSKIPDGNHMVHANGRSRNTETSRSTGMTSSTDMQAESILDEVHHSAWDDDSVSRSNMQGERKIGHGDDRCRSLETLETGFALSRASGSDVTSNAFPSAVQISEVSNKCTSGQLSLQHENINGGINVPRVNAHTINITYSEGDVRELSSFSPGELTNTGAAVNENTEHLCGGLSSINIGARFGIDSINMVQQQKSANEHCLNENFEDLNSRIQQHCSENEAECLGFTPGSSAAVLDSHVSGKFLDWRSEWQNQVLSSGSSGIDEGLTLANDHRLSLSVAPNSLSNLSYKNYSVNISNHLTNSFENGEVGDKRFSIEGSSRILGTQPNRDNDLLLLNGCLGETHSHFVKNGRILEYPSTSSNEGLYSGGFDNISNIKKAANRDVEEESIVSKIVSADFDPWDNSWSSANNFAKLLAHANKQEGPSKQSSTWMSQNNNQSRFLFARQENQANLGEGSYRDTGHSHLVSSKQESYGTSIGMTYPASNFEHAKVLGSRSSASLSDTTAGVMRTTKVSAPPGFSVPIRAPPPGFSSLDRYDQTFSTFSDTQLLGSPLQNQFQDHSTRNAGDVEFIDPAILAVGKGRLPIGVNNTGIGRLPFGVNSTGLGSRFSYHPQFSSAESDARIQLLMQQSMPANQDPRILNHIGDRFLQLDDAYTASRFSAQNPILTPYPLSHKQSSHILNSQWNGWSDIRNVNGMGLPYILMSEKLGLNNYIPVNEEPKFHLQNSGELYNDPNWLMIVSVLSPPKGAVRAKGGDQFIRLPIIKRDNLVRVEITKGFVFDVQCLFLGATVGSRSLQLHRCSHNRG